MQVFTHCGYQCKYDGSYIYPQVQFAQIEAQFTTRRIISQKTEFDYIVVSLSPEIVTEVRNLILTLPAENSFDTLKD